MTPIDPDKLEQIDSPQATAASWFAHVRSGRATEADQRAIEGWCAEQPANRQAWEDVQATWRAMEAVRADPAVLAMREQALSARPAPRFAAIRRPAMAASVALVAVGLSALALTEGVLPSRGGARVEAVAAERELRTGVGEQTRMTLADGSTVTLNTDSVVRITDMRDARRAVLLKGQAFFQVAKDPTRPFTVTAGGNKVTALGTAFDVRFDPRELAVTLVEGRVRVDGSAPRPRSTLMAAGSQLLVHGGEVRLTKVDTEQATSWLRGQLIFDGRPLSEVTDEMNRFSRKKIVLRDGALAAVPVSGVFRTGEVGTFAEALEAYKLARVARETDDRIELVRF